jgi:putative transcriptional regulator
MTGIIHHPGDPTLASYAAGTLDEARRLVVATHVSQCPSCQVVVTGLIQLGGIMLDDVEPAKLREGALAEALRALDQAPITPDATAGDEEFPSPLAGYSMGPWRWIGGGVHWRSVSVPVVDDIRVFMLRAKGGTQLPRHRHEGIEWTCILEGAFRHDLGRFGPGDFDEADASIEHNPVVEDGVACVCLVALKGNIQLQSFLGRLLQPLIRF